jgi:hypothetical protein
MPAPLLTTRLSVPPVRREWVPRPRLFEQLDAGLGRRLRLVSAPPGFGKTMLLSAWVHTLLPAGSGDAASRPRPSGDGEDPGVRQRRVDWLALDKGDNDAGRFWSYLIASLQDVAENVGASALAALQSGGRQLLHAGKLAEALQNIDVAGLPSSETNACGEGRCHPSFRAVPYRSAQGDRFMIPCMSGFGGNRVVFNPNGTIHFRSTDAVSYELEHT